MRLWGQFYKRAPAGACYTALHTIMHSVIHKQAHKHVCGWADTYLHLTAGLSSAHFLKWPFRETEPVKVSHYFLWACDLLKYNTLLSLQQLASCQKYALSIKLEVEKRWMKTLQIHSVQMSDWDDTRLCCLVLPGGSGVDLHTSNLIGRPLTDLDLHWVLRWLQGELHMKHDALKLQEQHLGLDKYLNY